MRHRDLEAGVAWVDPRTLVDEPTKVAPKLRPTRGTNWRILATLKVFMIVSACYMVGIQELLLAAFTHVECVPTTVRAGANASCSIMTSLLATEQALSITQMGVAGAISLISESRSSMAKEYRVAFATRNAGSAGVRVSHFIFWRTAAVEVLPGPAISVEVLCEPANVVPGAQVRCAVSPRDRHGNLANVERPTGAGATFFSVHATGRATRLVVEDDAVRFSVSSATSAQGPADRQDHAGILVTLDGRQFNGRVGVMG